MKYKEFEVIAKVQIFPGEKGWHYIQLTSKYTKMSKDLAVRGLVAITARIGTTAWNTSLLPKGNGTHFIPLSSEIREKENVKLNEEVKIFFRFKI